MRPPYIFRYFIHKTVAKISSFLERKNFSNLRIETTMKWENSLNWYDKLENATRVELYRLQCSYPNNFNDNENNEKANSCRKTMEIPEVENVLMNVNCHFPWNLKDHQLGYSISSFRIIAMIHKTIKLGKTFNYYPRTSFEKCPFRWILYICQRDYPLAVRSFSTTILGAYSSQRTIHIFIPLFKMPEAPKIGWS